MAMALVGLGYTVTTSDVDDNEVGHEHYAFSNT